MIINLLPLLVYNTFHKASKKRIKNNSYVEEDRLIYGIIQITDFKILCYIYLRWLTAPMLDCS